MEVFWGVWLWYVAIQFHILQKRVVSSQPRIMMEESRIERIDGRGIRDGKGYFQTQLELVSNVPISHIMQHAKLDATPIYQPSLSPTTSILGSETVFCIMGGSREFLHRFK